MTEETALRYEKGIGRRKEAVAQVRLTKGSGEIVVNGKPYKVYFPVLKNQLVITAPLRETGLENTFDVSVKTSGGGLTGQSDAIVLGIARALIVINPDLRPVLKKQGFLSRDARVKERKKYGLKKARRAPQWAKR